MIAGIARLRGAIDWSCRHALRTWNWWLWNWRLLLTYGIPTVLLLSWFAAHFSYDLIALLYPEPRQLAAARAWHSVLRAFPETTCLWIVVWVWCPRKPVALRYATSLVSLGGIIENLQIFACRIVYPMDRPPPKTELYDGLCDLLTGWPIYTASLVIILVVAALRWWEARWRRR